MSEPTFTRRDDAAMQAAILLKGFCKSRIDCDGCPFDVKQIFVNGAEQRYCNVRKPELWTQIDPYCCTVQCRKCGDDFQPDRPGMKKCHQCIDEQTNNRMGEP